MTTEQTARLAEIRGQWMRWGAVTDTATWETTFFFALIAEKDQQIQQLRTEVRQLKRVLDENLL